MTTPRLAAPELTTGQALPETTVNEQIRTIEQGAGHFIFKDRDLATPPGSPADGDCYLVSTSGTGVWSGQDGKIAFYLNTAWEFITAIEGFSAWVNDEDKIIIFDGSAWGDITASVAIAAPSTQSGTSYTAVIGDAQGYILFTNGAAITFTIPPNADVAFEVGTTISFEQNGAGAVTVAPGSGVTINSRGSLLDSAGQYAVAQLKKVGTNVWTLIGDVA